MKANAKTSSDGAIAIAVITAALKSRLSNGLVAFGNVSVIAQPPDKIVVGENEDGQINLFLYRVAPHTRLMTAKPSGLSANSEATALWLELNYLLTVYAAQDFQTEMLLGRAIQLIHESPVLNAAELNRAAQELQGKRTGKPGSSQSFNWIEEVRITPQFLNFEEMARLWSSLQARYRPSVAYQALPVLIHNRQS